MKEYLGEESGTARKKMAFWEKSKPRAKKRAIQLDEIKAEKRNWTKLISTN